MEKSEIYADSLTKKREQFKTFFSKIIECFVENHFVTKNVGILCLSIYYYNLLLIQKIFGTTFVININCVLCSKCVIL